MVINIAIYDVCWNPQFVLFFFQKILKFFCHPNIYLFYNITLQIKKLVFYNKKKLTVAKLNASPTLGMPL